MSVEQLNDLTIEQNPIKQRRNKIWSPNDCNAFRSRLNDLTIEQKSNKQRRNKIWTLHDSSIFGVID